ncbi:hypothetical protein T484DRAFT_1759961, partial [Baffinella frigidus]
SPHADDLIRFLLQALTARSAPRPAPTPSSSAAAPAAGPDSEADQTASGAASLARALEAIADSVGRALRLPRAAPESLEEDLSSSLDAGWAAKALLGPGSLIPALRLHATPAVSAGARAIYVALLLPPPGAAGAAGDWATFGGGGEGVVGILVGELEEVAGRLCKSADRLLETGDGAPGDAERTSLRRSVREGEAIGVLLASLLERRVRLGGGMGAAAAGGTVRAAARILRAAARAVALPALELALVALLGAVGAHEGRIALATLVTLVAALGKTVRPVASRGLKAAACAAAAATVGAVTGERASGAVLRGAALLLCALLDDSGGGGPNLLLCALLDDPDAWVRATALATVPSVARGDALLVLINRCITALADNDATVAAAALATLEKIAVGVLVNPIRLLAQRGASNFPGLGIAPWQRLLLQESPGGMRAVDFQKLVQFLAQRGHHDLLSVMPRAAMAAEGVAKAAGTHRALGGPGAGAGATWGRNEIELWAL